MFTEARFSKAHLLNFGLLLIVLSWSRSLLRSCQLRLSYLLGNLCIKKLHRSHAAIIYKDERIGNEALRL